MKNQVWLQGGTGEPHAAPEIPTTSCIHGLERPSDREADVPIIRQIRQLNILRESIWEEHNHALDPSARRWSRTRWCVVYRGKVCGVYADYLLAKQHLLQSVEP